EARLPRPRPAPGLLWLAPSATAGLHASSSGEASWLECRDGRSLLNACRRAAAAARRRACSGASAPPRRACFSQEVSAGGRDGRGNVRGQERAALRSRRCDFFGRQAFHRPVPGAWSLRGRFVFQPRASVLA
ncbi:unnamed protein product, partial [Prorocentrum cordatum]